MDHLALMNKKWGMLEKVLTKEKIIESRWYLSKYAPWDKVKKWDTIYFKNSGEYVSVKATVSKVLQFENLDATKVGAILDKYGLRIGIVKERSLEYFEMFKNKKYCILMFIENPEKVVAFDINKNGYGAMASWIVVDDISNILY